MLVVPAGPKPVPVQKVQVRRSGKLGLCEISIEGGTKSSIFSGLLGVPWGYQETLMGWKKLRERLRQDITALHLKGEKKPLPVHQRGSDELKGKHTPTCT